MSDRCKVCDQLIETNRNAHLRRAHGIYEIKPAVNQYFEPITPPPSPSLSAIPHH